MYSPSSQSCRPGGYRRGPWCWPRPQPGTSQGLLTQAHGLAVLLRGSLNWLPPPTRASGPQCSFSPRSRQLQYPEAGSDTDLHDAGFGHPAAVRLSGALAAVENLLVNIDWCRLLWDTKIWKYYLHQNFTPTGWAWSYRGRNAARCWWRSFVCVILGRLGARAPTAQHRVPETKAVFDLSQTSLLFMVYHLVDNLKRITLCC